MRAMGAESIARRVIRRCRSLVSSTLATAPLAFTLVLPSGAFGQTPPGTDPLSADPAAHPFLGKPPPARSPGTRRAINSPRPPRRRSNRRGWPPERTLLHDGVAVDDLIQAIPVSRGVPSERTEVWIGFDDANLYVAARVWDSLGEAGGLRTRCAGTRINSA